MLDLPFQADRASETPLRQQLALHLRSLVATGRLAPGEKLPATRELASSLGIGRNTVLQAYEALIDEGILIAQVGQGTFVATTASSLRLAKAPGEGAPRPFAWEALLSRSARLPLPGWLRAPLRPDAIAFDFRGGRVDSEALPTTALRRAFSRAIADELPKLANEVDPLGHPPLRREIARVLLARGIRCEPGEIIVTSGAQQALDLTARVLVDPGDAVAIEQPGYFGAAMTFAAAGAELVGIEVDAEGLRTDALARVLRARRLKLVYATPAAQLPTGATLTDPRRRALLELADETQTPIVEDDYDSEFRYDDPALPALKTQDAAGQIVYIGTFSKALFPGLRLGYAVAAPSLLQRLVTARFTASFAIDTLSQAAIAEMLRSGAFERHVRKLRKRYAERRGALLAALEDAMPEGARWTKPRAGLNVWLTLPPDIDAVKLQADALDRGIAYVDGRSCYVDGRGASQIALAFSNQSPGAIARGVEALGELMLRQRRQRQSA